MYIAVTAFLQKIITNIHVSNNFCAISQKKKKKSRLFQRMRVRHWKFSLYEFSNSFPIMYDGSMRHIFLNLLYLHSLQRYRQQKKIHNITLLTLLTGHDTCKTFIQSEWYSGVAIEFSLNDFYD